MGAYLSIISNVLAASLLVVNAIDYKYYSYSTLNKIGMILSIGFLMNSMVSNVKEREQLNLFSLYIYGMSTLATIPFSSLFS